MGYTASRVVDIVNAEIGYKEKASNSDLDSKTRNAGSKNYTKYARDLAAAGYYQANKQGYEWCDMLNDWCHLQAADGDAKLAQETICQTGPYGAGCTFSMQYYQQQKRFDKNPKIGDQIFFRYSGSTGADHTGIVVGLPEGKVVTVEGNSGNCVQQRTYNRNDSTIVGYGHPKYAAETAATVTPAPAPKAKNKIEEDGKWGTKTTRKAQEVFGTTVDGIVSQQDVKYKATNRGLTSGWEWVNKPKKGGSELIRAIQKWVGVDMDGILGPVTIRAMQHKLGTTEDGYFSTVSDCIMAFQRWLNKQ